MLRCFVNVPLLPAASVSVTTSFSLATAEPRSALRALRPSRSVSVLVAPPMALACPLASTPLTSCRLSVRAVVDSAVSTTRTVPASLGLTLSLNPPESSFPSFDVPSASVAVGAVSSIGTTGGATGGVVGDFGAAGGPAGGSAGGPAGGSLGGSTGGPPAGSQSALTESVASAVILSLPGPQTSVSTAPSTLSITSSPLPASSVSAPPRSVSSSLPPKPNRKPSPSAPTSLSLPAPPKTPSTSAAIVSFSPASPSLPTPASSVTNTGAVRRE